MGLVSVRLHGWAARAVDPSAELAEELAALGDLADGEQRHSVQQVLRRLLTDPGLSLLVRAGDGVWVDPAGVAVGPADRRCPVGRHRGSGSRDRRRFGAGDGRSTPPVG